MFTTFKNDTFFFPTTEEINALQVGDLAPASLGGDEKGLGRVTKITARKEDINGNLFVCYYTEFGENAEISHSMKAGELVRTLRTSNKYTSHELDVIEQHFRKTVSY